MTRGAGGLVANVFDVAAALQAGIGCFVILGGRTVTARRQQVGINGVSCCAGRIGFLEEGVAQLILSHGGTHPQHENREQG